MINAERPLALMFMAISPFASPRLTKETSGMATPGQKQGIFAPRRRNGDNPPLRARQDQRFDDGLSPKALRSS
jgi:hypothetical protein